MRTTQSAQDVRSNEIDTVNVVEVTQRNLSVVVRKGLRNLRQRLGRVRRYAPRSTPAPRSRRVRSRRRSRAPPPEWGASCLGEGDINPEACCYIRAGSSWNSCGSEALGSRRSSVIESAKPAKVEPRAYLREATRRAVRNPGIATLPRELK